MKRREFLHQSICATTGAVAASGKSNPGPQSGPDLANAQTQEDHGGS